MRVAKLLLCFGLVLPLTGCIASTTLVSLQPDGSGTIETTTTMNPQAIAQMMQMMGATETSTSGKPTELFTETEAKAAATKLGEDVRFVSATKIKTADAEGLKAVYAFDDINKIRVSQKPAAPGGGAGAPGMSMGGSQPEDVTFSLTKQANGNSLLAIRFPEPNLTLNKDDAKPAPADVPPQALDIMKQMFKGLRIDMAMQVDGRIIKTNSPYQNGSTITLLSIDFEKLLANEAMLEKMQNPRSLQEAKTMLKDLPGVKVNLEREITVEFAPK